MQLLGRVRDTARPRQRSACPAVSVGNLAPEGCVAKITGLKSLSITGPARATDNKQDTRLRKLSLRWERFTNGVLTAHAVSDAPQVSRRAEAR